MVILACGRMTAARNGRRHLVMHPRFHCYLFGVALASLGSRPRLLSHPFPLNTAWPVFARMTLTGALPRQMAVGSFGTVVSA